MTERYIKISVYAKDITGLRSGKLVALGPIGRNHFGLLWECQCDCGNISVVRAARLIASETKSCGCILGKQGTHGMTYTKIFEVWSSMKSRCSDPDNAHYGARGITVCDEWNDSFQMFHDYVSKLSNFNRDGYSIDRIDSDGNYEPGNVRWATGIQQRRNQRRCLQIGIGDATRTPAEWSEISGIPAGLIAHRIKEGWSAYDAVFKPARRKRVLTIDGESRTLAEWARLRRVNPDTIRGRLRRGWTMKDAIGHQ